MPGDVLHPCPRCHSGGGRPYRAIRQDEKTLRVLLRCDGCRHRWSALVAPESLPAEAREQLSGVGLWRPLE